MAVYSVLADIFNMDIENIVPNSDLRNDLGMTAAVQTKLKHAINDMFDNTHLDFNRIKTVQDIAEQIIKSKMTVSMNYKTQ